MVEDIIVIEDFMEDIMMIIMIELVWEVAVHIAVVVHVQEMAELDAQKRTFMEQNLIITKKALK